MGSLMMRSHFEAGDLSRVLGGLALGVIEIRWNGDHGLGDLAAQVGLGRFLQLCEDHGRDFGRRILLAIDLHTHVVIVAADDFVGHHLHFFVDFVIAAPHEPFDREYRVRRVGDGLSFGDLADQALAGLGERHDGRRSAGPLLVCNDRRLAGFHDGDRGVGGAQINTDDLSHILNDLSFIRLAITAADKVRVERAVTLSLCLLALNCHWQPAASFLRHELCQSSQTPPAVLQALRLGSSLINEHSLGAVAIPPPGGIDTKTSNSSGLASPSPLSVRGAPKIRTKFAGGAERRTRAALWRWRPVLLQANQSQGPPGRRQRDSANLAFQNAAFAFCLRRTPCPLHGINLSKEGMDHLAP